jgi:hypothetical protein
MKYPVPLAEIIWHDAATTQGWELHGDVDTEEELMITVGFIIAKGKNTIVVASSIDREHHAQSNSRIKIPIAMIQSIKELNTTYKKEKNVEEVQDGT